MNTNKKYNLILDSFQELLEKKDINSISVNEIAQKAGIAKGGIYYYFKSKDEMLHALIERTYSKTLESIKHISEQSDVEPFSRLAMMFKTFRDTRASFPINNERDGAPLSFLHHKHMSYIISTLKPYLSSVITEAIDCGDIDFDNADALAEIALIVLTVKLDNTISPSSEAEIANTLQGLISLIGKLTNSSNELLNFILE